MSPSKIERLQPIDEEILEEWGCVTDDADILGVGCSRTADEDWPWRVGVSVMEFVRTEPLESQLAAAITSALSHVPGVGEALHEDRETWIVSGVPYGARLARVVAEVLDQFASRTRAAVAQSQKVAEPDIKARPWWRFW